MDNKKNWLVSLLILTLLEGLIAVFFLFAVQSEAQSVYFLGLSKQRLVIAGGFILLLSTLAGLILKIYRNLEFKKSLNLKLINFLENKASYPVLLIFLTLITGVLGLLFWIISDSSNTVHLAYYQRLSPILWWGFVGILQSILFLRVFHLGTKTPKNLISFIKTFLFILLPATILVTFVLTSRIGITPDAFQWRGPGAPLLGWQILLAIVFSLVVFGLSRWIIKKYPSFKIDLLIGFVLWVLAFSLWNAEPLQLNYFNPGIAPPTNQFYPASDASNYDISAYHLLIGNGFEPNVRRPLLSFFLAIGHAFVGDSYDAIITWQIIFYAFFPVALYFLTRLLDNRISGVVVASLAILREINGINLSGKIYVSNSKMIMSDFPTMLGIALIIYFFSKWLIHAHQSKKWLYLAGGTLGLTMLIRVQVAVLVVIILAFIWINGRYKFKPLLQNSGVFLLGVSLVILPWLTRNYFVTGTFNFSDFTSESQGGLIEERYLNNPENPSENPTTLTYVLNNSQEVLRFVGAHFFHNQINTLLIFPAQLSLAQNINTYINTQEHWLDPGKYWTTQFAPATYVTELPYWPEWVEDLTPQAYSPLALNLLIILFGITIAYRKYQLAGIFPLFAYFMYLLGLAVFRISGWRFIMPVDWIGFLYFSIGIVGIINLIWCYFTNQTFETSSVNSTSQPSNPFSQKQAWRLCTAFFVISLSIPLTEVIIPSRFTKDTLNEILDESNASLNNSLDLYISNRNGSIIQGIALYPRFDVAEQGTPNSQWPSHIDRPYSRLGFLLIAPNHAVIHVIFPMDTSPTEFDNGSEVVVFGCLSERVIFANAVLLQGNASSAELIKSNDNQPCP